MTDDDKPGTPDARRKEPWRNETELARRHADLNNVETSPVTAER
jgi:hypothetical protein